MQFPEALDLVVKALEQMRQTSRRPPCASRSRLDQLFAARARNAAAVSVAEAPEPAPSALPNAAHRAAASGAATGSSRRNIAKADRPGAAASVAGTVGPGAGTTGAGYKQTSRPEQLNALNARVATCMKCGHLASSRTQTVFGVGNPGADLMFVGEAPGADEDLQGEPFVGRAGQLLTKIIQAMGFSRGDVYIANILKCRPNMPKGAAGNRPPTLDEMQTCLPFLREQINIVGPKVLVALGATAVEGLLGTRGSMRELRGRWHDFNGTPLMITYHPAYLLRNQSNSEKRKVWEDMLLVLEKLERPITEKQRNYFR